ncbi:Wadjet anti-phage system protein JetA family protein [Pseudomonas sp.]|uniref:Wadjet anti-phage system protein JetA family protein n=1 Tax=Pseudomonas sp. TaxID=306 RepID=UPI00324300B0
MFFTNERLQFFRPLTSKYREQIVECLRLLHERLYSARADYGESLKREQVLDIFSEALERAPLLESEDEDASRFKSNREQASWILTSLIENGWLERQVDQATFQSTYPFSRMGRLFAQSLAEAHGHNTRTRHRNTRNTLNALSAFAEHGEVYDLLDAHEYAERIIADFTDIIAELEERKRQLVREVEAQQLVQQASDQFFDFMERRFQPDLAVRLSADSVEKHRERIQDVIARIRRKPREWKAEAERELRRLAPDLLVDERSSILWQLLDGIEGCLRNAADIMLPALRRTLQSFTQRADIIIRQLSYLHSQKHSDIVGLCRELSALPAEEQAKRLSAAGEEMAVVNLALVDPGQVKLRERRERPPVHSLMETLDAPEDDTLRTLAVNQLLDKAFNVNASGVRNYLRAALGNGSQLNTRDLPVNSASDLLALSHVIALASAEHAASGLRVRIEPSGETISNETYFDRRDGFIIDLEHDEHA